MKNQQKIKDHKTPRQFLWRPKILQKISLLTGLQTQKILSQTRPSIELDFSRRLLLVSGRLPRVPRGPDGHGLGCMPASRHRGLGASSRLVHHSLYLRKAFVVPTWSWSVSCCFCRTFSALFLSCLVGFGVSAVAIDYLLTTA